MTKKEEANKEELIINTVHNKVNKEDIYLIWIMKKLLTELDYFFLENNYWYWQCKWFWMFILKKEEKYFFKESKLSHIFLNYYKNGKREKSCRVLEYELNDEYTLVVYCLWLYKHKINKIIQSNISTLQSVFRDKTLWVFQQKLVDIFWLYWSFTIIQMLLHYFDHDVFYIWWLFWTWSVKKNLWKLWEWDVTIDISILEKIIQEWKERFQEKLDLLYLLLSNINKKTMKSYYFDHFFNFLEEWIEKFKIKEKDIENQDINSEFKTYTMKMHYLCSYLFKEFFNDHVYWWSKKLISFYKYEKSTCVYDWKNYTEQYLEFNLDHLKKVALLIDQKLYKKYS